MEELTLIPSISMLYFTRAARKDLPMTELNRFIPDGNITIDWKEPTLLGIKEYLLNTYGEIAKTYSQYNLTE